MKTENNNSLNTLKAKTFAVFVLQGSFRAVFSKKKTYLQETPGKPQESLKTSASRFS